MQMKEEQFLEHSKDLDLTRRDWDVLMSQSEKVEMQNGEVIIPSYGPNGKFYRVLSGNVSCILTKGDEILAKFIMGNDASFGHRSLLKRFQTPFAFVVNSESCQLQCVEASVLNRLLRIEPEVSLRFYNNMAILFCTMLKTLEHSTAEPVYIHGKNREPDEATASKTKFKKRFPLVNEVLLKEFRVDFKTAWNYHGVLYFTHKFICFHSRIFGFRKKRIILFSRIIKWNKSSMKGITLTLRKQTKTTSVLIGCETTAIRDEILRIIEDLIATQKGEEIPSGELEAQFKMDQMGKAFFDPQEDTPSKEEWNMILKNAKCLQFKKGEMIIREGEKHCRLFQLTNGKCIVQKTVDNVTKAKLSNSIGGGEVFGEMSFLKGDPAMETVIADSDDVEIYAIERHTMKVLFSVNPLVGMKFYKYLTIVLEKRLFSKEKQLLDIEPTPFDV